MKTILAKLLGVASSVWNFYAPILKQIFSSGVEALLPIALEIVTALASQKISGEKKFDIAVKKLSDAAVKSGIDASTSIIRFTVESAVQKLKADI